MIRTVIIQRNRSWMIVDEQDEGYFHVAAVRLGQKHAGMVTEA